MSETREPGAVDRREAEFALADLQYPLPEHLIAQHPPPRRDESRLLLLDRAAGESQDARIVDLPDLLEPEDLLVLNDTRVLPAKLTARRRTGGKVRGLFIREEEPGRWLVMLEGSRRLRVGESLSVSGIAAGDGAAADPDAGGGDVTLELVEACGRGVWRAHVDAEGTAEEILSRIGKTPLPPYIHRDDADLTADREDRSRYQTVYARRPGAIAAPTAGLHLTDALLSAIRDRGVETTGVTLHVGVGTFQPIQVQEVSDHVMHAEWYELRPETVEAVGRCRKRGGRVVAVGTTSVRVLEAASAGRDDARLVRASSGTTDLFIYPPFRFQVVDALLTNFHLPGSTLLALVMAFAGIENIRRAYRRAVESDYRFYSYGDAMLIV